MRRCQHCSEPLPKETIGSRRYCDLFCRASGEKEAKKQRQAKRDLAKSETEIFNWNKATQFKAQNGRCIWCGASLAESIVEIDHLVPICKGGKHIQGNLVLTCQSCNRKKGARLPWHYVKVLNS